MNMEVVMRSGYFFKMATILAYLVASIAYADAAQDSKSSDKTIKKAIIKESIANYPGNCPCPYNLARNGSRCGKRSAYSRPGGYAPICYESDVTLEMIKEWQAMHAKP